MLHLARAALTKIKVGRLFRPETSAGEPVSGEEIARLVQAQIAPWTGVQTDPKIINAEFDRLNTESSSVFVYDVSHGRARPRRKEHPTSNHSRAIQQNMTRTFRNRACQYESLFNVALASGLTCQEFSLAVDVNDVSMHDTHAPLFAFQKPRGSRIILIPDVDFLGYAGYLGITDRTPYDCKTPTACFCGSSTGAYFDEAIVQAQALPRLRLAARFTGHSDVIFRIAVATQCFNAETKALLKRQPYFGPRMSWEEQFRHKFLISVDGNGAACSRPAIALKSNSALIKFESPYELYFFSALVPGRDYLAAAEPEDIERIIDREKSSPGYYRDIALEGATTFKRFLTPAAVLEYTTRLLHEYAMIVAP